MNAGHGWGRLLGVLAGLVLGAAGAVAQEPAAGKKLVAVCSTTQVADFTRQVVGDRWEVVSILAPGQDPHLYELTAEDARTAARADLCVQNGWHLEGGEWMATLASGAGKPLVTCVEGMLPLEIEAEGVTVHDPHAWHSPAAAAIYVRNITKAVCRLDPGHEAEYRARAEFYLDQIRTLHVWIIKQLSQVPVAQRRLVTSHDAFGYFCREYGFTAVSPAGWSTGQEAGGGVTADRRQQVVASIREHGVKAIFVETSVNPDMVRQIAKDAGVTVGGELFSDSMGPPGTAAETYLGMMRENVLTIVAALK